MSYAIRSIGAACLLVMGQACMAAPEASSEPVRPGQQIFFWSQPLSVFDPGFVDAEERVIDNSAGLATAWATLYENRPSLPSLPIVDFDKEVIVLLAMGMRRTAGYQIENPRVIYTGHSVQVSYVLQEPGLNCVAPTSITSPALLLRMAKPKVPFEFKSTASRRNCQ